MRRLILGMLAALVAGCGWGTVNPGERAVFSHWGSLDRWPGCFKEGLYFYNPFTTDMWELDVKVQKLEVKKATAASRDLQDVHSNVVVNFAVDGERCHLLVKEVGTDFSDRVLVPAVHEVLKQATAHFPVAEIITQRAKLRTEILDGLRARLTRYHLVIHDVALTDFGFSPSFAKAIEQKQVEEQGVQRKEYERQQAEKDGQAKLALATGQAAANLAIARAEADGNLLKAKATAEGNRLVRESLTAELISFKTVESWDGRLPQIVGSGAIPLLNLDMRQDKAGAAPTPRSLGPATPGKALPQSYREYREEDGWMVGHYGVRMR